MAAINFIFSSLDPIVNLNLFLILYPSSVDLNIIPFDCSLLKTYLAENLAFGWANLLSASSDYLITGGI